MEVGSFSYLQSAVEENDDVAVNIHDEATGASFESAFNNMWNDGEAFKVMDYSRPIPVIPLKGDAVRQNKQDHRPKEVMVRT